MSKKNQPITVVATFFEMLVMGLFYLSAVEWLKRAAVAVFSNSTPESKRAVSIVAIDTFIFAKWIFLLVCWAFMLDGIFFRVVMIYLLIMNSHTYFYYHVWRYEGPQPNDHQRDRRRFVNLAQAVGFSTFGFALVYRLFLETEFQWPEKMNRSFSAILFSIGNALTGFSGDTKPLSATASALVSLQLVTTFVFLAVMLSNSIPRTRD